MATIETYEPEYGGGAWSHPLTIRPAKRHRMLGEICQQSVELAVLRLGEVNFSGFANGPIEINVEENQYWVPFYQRRVLLTIDQDQSEAQITFRDHGRTSC